VGTRSFVISIDPMSGECGPAQFMSGLAAFVSSSSCPEGLRFILHGKSQELESLVSAYPSLQDRVDIEHAPGVVAMDDKPSYALRYHRDSSMWKAINSVRDGYADAVVSCGNTGSLMAMSLIQLRRVTGADRPAIAGVFPRYKKSGMTIVLDLGADVKADERNLTQYALMGVEYARLLGDNIPKVAMLNVGVEQNKGPAAVREASAVLSKIASDPDAGFEYIEFVEGKDLLSGVADVIVTDGFSGNIALKAVEGCALYFSNMLRDALSYKFMGVPIVERGVMMMFPKLRYVFKRSDPRRANGGVLLGLNGIVVKGHGDSDDVGVSSVLGVAANAVKNDLSGRISLRLASLTEGEYM